MKKENHLEVLIGSLNKMFLNARNKGIIKNKEIFLLNIIYKILKADCYIQNKEKETKELLSIYYRILNKYTFLCKSDLSKDYYFKHKNINKTINVCLDECPEPTKKSIVYFWQEKLRGTTIDDIESLINEEYLLDKNKASYEEASDGVIVDCEYIAKIVFVATNTQETNFIVKDVLGNDITQYFEIRKLEDLNSVMICSLKPYSFGEVFLKLKKQPTWITQTY